MGWPGGSRACRTRKLTRGRAVEGRGEEELGTRAQKYDVSGLQVSWRCFACCGGGAVVVAAAPPRGARLVSLTAVCCHLSLNALLQAVEVAG